MTPRESTQETPTAGRADVPAVEARGLTTTYGRRRRHRGIVGIDLTVRAGEVVGLVGANGAGKTTFMRTLLDFVRPASGSVSCFGLDSVLEGVAMRRRLTYLPGELVLPHQLTGHEALQRYTIARAALDCDRVARLAKRLDLDLGRRLGELSKGNRQKVGLVLAFAPVADLLVLDEPTSGLDPVLQREFLHLVRERSEQGTAVLLSSHVMSEVQQVASRVALLRDGRIQACSELSTLLTESRRRGRVQPVHEVDRSRIAEALDHVHGVSGVAVEGEGIAFACTGEMDALIKILAGFEVTSLDVAHADLEDAFFAESEPDEARDHGSSSMGQS